MVIKRDKIKTLRFLGSQYGRHAIRLALCNTINIYLFYVIRLIFIYFKQTPNIVFTALGVYLLKTLKIAFSSRGTETEGLTSFFGPNGNDVTDVGNSFAVKRHKTGFIFSEGK